MLVRNPGKMLFGCCGSHTNSLAQELGSWEHCNRTSHRSTQPAGNNMHTKQQQSSSNQTPHAEYHLGRLFEDTAKLRSS